MRCERRASSHRRWALAALLAGAALVSLLTGCGHQVQLVPIRPDAAGQGKSFGLGPGVSPLSFGPGDKSSPAWAPSGDRIAFVIDGYVAEKSPGSRELHRQTTRNFGAEQAGWLPSGNALAILGTDLSTDPNRDNPDSVYLTRSNAELQGVKRVADGVLAMSKGPGGAGLVVARKAGPSGNALALIDDQGEPGPAYAVRVAGEITGVSVSPDGKRAVLAARDQNRCRLYTFDFADKVSRRIAQLDPGVEVLGAPQWTSRGVYYVAGKPAKTGSEKTVPYHLYRLQDPGAPGRAPTLAPSAGEDFIASSIQPSPDGERLAVIGRRSPGSSTNLYLLDPAAGSLDSLTANENMEIKTGPGDLAWSPDGRWIAIIARGALQGPEVYPAPASTLLRAFYNLYEVPVDPAGKSK